MTASVITIARTMGARGEGLGWSLAELLGYRYVDDEVLARAAARAAVRPDDIAQVERRRKLVDKLVESLAMGAGAGYEAGAFFALCPPSRMLESVLVDVLQELADEGRIVLVAHGAGLALRDRPDVLRCLVTASAEVRAERVPGGRRAIDEADKARRDFFRRFFHRDERTDDYDLVVNTDRLDLDDAVEAVARAAAIRGGRRAA